MTGKQLFIGLGIFLVIFACGLFYALNFAHYSKADHARFEIAGLAVENYKEIDAQSSPIKFRACFEVVGSKALYGDDEGATPLVAPYWFDCFNAKTLTDDLEAGAINAIRYEDNVPYGVSSFIIVYPDGRGYAWRQLNECGEATFSGEAPPETCPKHETNNG